MTASGRYASASGFPSPADGFEEARIDLNRELIPSLLSTFILRVQGDAMHRDGIRDGDLVVIDRSVESRAGCVVVAVFEGHFIVRRLCLDLHRPSGFRLESGDGRHPPIPLQDDGQGGAELWGVVIHAVHHLVAAGGQPRQAAASGGGESEGGGHEAATAQLTLELQGQPIAAPGPAELTEQRQATADDDQAHEHLQAELQHGVS